VEVFQLFDRVARTAWRVHLWTLTKCRSRNQTLDWSGPQGAALVRQRPLRGPQTSPQTTGEAVGTGVPQVDHHWPGAGGLVAECMAT